MNIFLDFDGTIVDPRARYHAVYVAALDHCGASPVLDVDAYWAMKRARKPESEILAAHHSGVDAAAYTARRMALIEAPEMLALDPLLPGAAEALDSLATTGTLYLVTMRRNRAALEGQLDGLGITQKFAAVLSRGAGDDAVGAKVDLMADIAAAGDWIIGDTEADVNAGKALGLRTIAVCSGIREPSFLRALDPDHPVDGLPDAAGVIAAR